MATKNLAIRSSNDSSSSYEDLVEFLGLLNEMKSTGCTLLVVGGASRHCFTRASAQLLGDDDAVRHRVLAVTDRSGESIVERLPDPDEAPRPLGETTHVLNHAGTPRSVTAGTDSGGAPELADVRETCVADPQLEGLQTALVEAIRDFGRQGGETRPATLRVGIDSLMPLLDHYGEDVVRRCLRMVGAHVREQDGMGHYVLPKPYESDVVQSLSRDVDAVIEIRNVEVETYGHAAQERWHVPSRDLTMDWTPL